MLDGLYSLFSLLLGTSNTLTFNKALENLFIDASNFFGWLFAIMTGNSDWFSSMGLESRDFFSFFNNYISFEPVDYLSIALTLVAGLSIVWGLVRLLVRLLSVRSIEL